MVGEKEETVRLLIEQVDKSNDNIKDVLDFAVEFKLDDEMLWNCIIDKCQGDLDKIKTVMQYSDIFTDPSRFIDALDDDVEISEIQDALTSSYSKLKGQTSLLESALDTSIYVREKLEQEWLKNLTSGFVKSINSCHSCGIPFKITQMAQGKDQFQSTIVVYRCGHNFHKYCIKKRPTVVSAKLYEDDHADG